jgi:hypothetical protein
MAVCPDFLAEGQPQTARHKEVKSRPSAGLKPSPQHHIPGSKGKRAGRKKHNLLQNSPFLQGGVE